MESIPVIRQNLCQSQVPPKIFAMPIGPERDLLAETSPANIFLKPLMLSQTILKASSVPSGIDSAKYIQWWKFHSIDWLESQFYLLH